MLVILSAEDFCFLLKLGEFEMPKNDILKAGMDVRVIMLFSREDK